MVRFRVDHDLCIQCGECTLDCPAGVLIMDNYPRMVNEAGCYRCQHCLAICPTGAVSVLGLDPGDSTKLAGNFPEPGRLETLIKGRRSVRRYTGRDLSPALIDRLLDVAWHAPTGVNSQSVLFTVVRERRVMDCLRKEVMDGLEQLLAAGKIPAGFVGQYMGAAVKGWREEERDLIFRGAPHLLVASAPKNSPCPVQDTHIALTTFQLVAEAHGVGSVWDGLFMMAFSLMPEIHGRLGIPDDHLVGYAILFGEPAVAYQRTVQRGPCQINIVG